MEKRIHLENSYSQRHISRNKLFIEEKSLNNDLDERYLLLYSFINKYESFESFPFFNKVLELLYAYFPTWSMEECKISLKYIERIIKENKHWQYFFLNKNYNFIDLFFNEFQK